MQGKIMKPKKTVNKTRWRCQGSRPTRQDDHRPDERNGEQLVTLLMEHGIGVRRSIPDLFEIDEDFGTRVGK